MRIGRVDLMAEAGEQTFRRIRMGDAAAPCGNHLTVRSQEAHVRFQLRIVGNPTVARKTLNGRFGGTPFGTAESVDVRTALRSYTIWAAHQLFLENRIGSIEVGKDADLAVWDRNLYTVPTDALKDLKCEMTLFRGAIVYGSR